MKRRVWMGILVGVLAGCTSMNSKWQRCQGQSSDVTASTSAAPSATTDPSSRVFVALASSGSSPDTAASTAPAAPPPAAPIQPASAWSTKPGYLPTQLPMNASDPVPASMPKPVPPAPMPLPSTPTPVPTVKANGTPTPGDSPWAPLPATSGVTDRPRARIVGIGISDPSRTPVAAADRHLSAADTRALVPEGLLPGTWKLVPNPVAQAAVASPPGSDGAMAAASFTPLPVSGPASAGSSAPLPSALPKPPVGPTPAPFTPPEAHEIIRARAIGAAVATGESTPHVCACSTVDETEHGPAVTPVVRIVNTKRISLNYELHDVGPTGAADIELWYTRDGRTWQKHGTTRQSQPPYIVEVEDEDLYGFTLLVHQSGGPCAHHPQEGDPPQVWVEVDTTRPSVRLLGLQATKTGSDRRLTILWRASDKNLGPKPMAISYATQPEGPWLVVAGKLENTGRYVWQMPWDVPARCYVRVEATDLAGNIGAAQAPVDLAQPRAAIVAVEATAAAGR